MATAITGEVERRLNQAVARAVSDPTSLLAPASLATRCVREYISWLGIVSASPRGVELLKKAEMFQQFYRLADTSATEYLARHVISVLDYFSAHSADARALFLHYLTFGSIALRHYLISNIRLMLRGQQLAPPFTSHITSTSNIGSTNPSPVSKSGAVPAAIDPLSSSLYWLLEMLVSQIRPGAPPSPATPSGMSLAHEVELSLAAIAVLDEACSHDPTALAMTITLCASHLPPPPPLASPSESTAWLQARGKGDRSLAEAVADQARAEQEMRRRRRWCAATTRVGAAMVTRRLLTQFLAIAPGVAYLEAMGWIQAELEWWHAEGNRTYAEAIENDLFAAVNRNTSDGHADEERASTWTTQASHRIPPAERTKHDDHYFQRVHQLPWVISASIVHPNGREQPIHIDTYTETMPLSVLKQRSAHHTTVTIGGPLDPYDDSNLSSTPAALAASAGAATLTGSTMLPAWAPVDPSTGQAWVVREHINAFDPLVTLVTGRITDPQGWHRSILLEPRMNVRATLTVGASDLSANHATRPVLFSSSTRSLVLDALNADVNLPAAPVRGSASFVSSPFKPEAASIAPVYAPRLSSTGKSGSPEASAPTLARSVSEATPPRPPPPASGVNAGAAAIKLGRMPAIVSTCCLHEPHSDTRWFFECVPDPEYHARTQAVADPRRGRAQLADDEPTYFIVEDSSLSMPVVRHVRAGSANDRGGGGGGFGLDSPMTGTMSSDLPVGRSISDSISQAFSSFFSSSTSTSTSSATPTSAVASSTMSTEVSDGPYILTGKLPRRATITPGSYMPVNDSTFSACHAVMLFIRIQCS
jgi:hypothetical protein